MIIHQFESKIEKTPNCWLWNGRVNKFGYGTYGSKLAHRIAYELYNRPIPDGFYVCHSCDVRNCVNPAHLWVGTQQENIQDMHTKCRGFTGDQRFEKNPNAKVTKDEVFLIFNLKKSGLSNRVIGKQIGLSHTQISNILNGKNWRISNGLAS